MAKRKIKKSKVGVKSVLEYSPVIISSHELVNIKVLKDRLTDLNLIYADPLGQRSPVIESSQNEKNQGIIEAIFRGSGIGQITIRDISKIIYLQKVYGSYKFLVIDGGHRCRAIVDFMKNRFYILLNGKKKRYRDLTDEERNYFLNFIVPLDIKICSPQQAIQIFKDLNKSDKVNAYEMLMSDDQSRVTEYVRRKHSSYREYGDNQIHPIFERGTSPAGDPIATHFNSLNKKAILSTYVFTVLIKALQENPRNCDAGVKEAKNLVNKAYKDSSFTISSKVDRIVDRFFDDLRSFSKHSGKITIDTFGFFQCVWFHLASEYGVDNFKLEMDDFGKEFTKLRALLTGKGTVNKKYNNIIVKDIEGQDDNLKKLLKEYVKAFSYGDRQEYAAKLILEYFKEEMEAKTLEDLGIIILDSKRTVNKKERFEILACQDNQCYIDLKTDYCPQQGRELALEDSVLGHDKPHSKGGRTEDGKVLCKSCNADMGTLTISEYIKVLKDRHNDDEDDFDDEEEDEDNDE